MNTGEIYRGVGIRLNPDLIDGYFLIVNIITK